MSRATIIGKGTIAEALRTASGGKADFADALFLIAEATDDTGQLIARLRSSRPGAGGAIVLLVSPDVPALERALLIAAIAPLAIEHAPDIRVSAVDIGSGGADDAVVEAALFLAAAGGTTGQVLRIDNP